jgi:hypothetical protein
MQHCITDGTNGSYVVSCRHLAKNDQFPPAAAHKRAEAGRGAEELNKEDEFDGQENSRARRFWNVLALKSSCPCFPVSCAGIAEAGLGRPAVPTLPDAGGAVFDGEKPRDGTVSLWMSRQATSPAPRPVSGLRPIFASASINHINSSKVVTPDDAPIMSDVET